MLKTSAPKFVLLFILILILAACGQNSRNPVSNSVNFLTAASAGDREEALRYVCAVHHPEIMQLGQLDGDTSTYSDISCTEVSRNGSIVDVVCTLTEHLPTGDVSAEVEISTVDTGVCNINRSNLSGLQK